MSTDPITLRVSPADFTELLEMVEKRIRSERARASAFRRIGDRSNEMVAEGHRDRLRALRDALIAAAGEGDADV